MKTPDYGYNAPLNNRCARIYKDHCTKKCTALSEIAGQDILCPFPMLRANGCEGKCDVTSNRNCLNCAYMVSDSDGASYCLTQHQQGCINGGGNNCPDWVARKQDEEDAGTYVNRRILEMNGQFAKYGILESQQTRKLRIKARQEWLNKHKLYEWRYSGEYKYQYLPNQNVSKEDALKVGKLMREAADKVDWHDAYSIEQYKKYGMSIAKHLVE